MKQDLKITGCVEFGTPPEPMPKQLLTLDQIAEGIGIQFSQIDVVNYDGVLIDCSTPPLN